MSTNQHVLYCLQLAMHSTVPTQRVFHVQYVSTLQFDGVCQFSVLYVDESADSMSFARFFPTPGISISSSAVTAHVHGTPP